MNMKQCHENPLTYGLSSTFGIVRKGRMPSIEDNHDQNLDIFRLDKIGQA